MSSLCAFTMALAALAPQSARAQAVLGIGDDALVLPRGALRIRFMPSWTEFDSRYGLNTPNRENGSVEPLAVDFNLDTIGTKQFESLIPLQAGLRALTGITDWQPTLGKIRVGLTGSVRALPIVAELGLTQKISMGLVVPFVRTRNEVSFNVNPAGNEGNIGFNPALANQQVADANAALFAQYQAATTALNALVANCTSAAPTDPRCPAIASRMGQLQSLAAGATQFTGGLAQVYSSSPFIPITGTVADLAIRSRLGFFSTQFAGLAALGIPNLPSAAPTASQSQLGVNDAQRILTDPAFGVTFEPLETVEKTELGDIELAAKYQFFNGLGDQERYAPPTGFRYRGAVTAVVRFPTGKTDSPNNLVDIGTGNGQFDIELRQQNDFIFSRYLWASVVARYNMQLADHEVMRVTPVDRPLAALYRRQGVERDLGDIFELEVTPRFVLNDYFAVSGQYLYRNKAEDSYTGSFQVQNALGEDLTLDAEMLNEETKQVEHRIYGGISFSTVAAFQKGKVKIPFEVQFQHGQSVKGSGGKTPRIYQDMLQFRVYTRLFGGSEAAK
jgi:hypothetical protein